jgi:hypothetical protein
LKKIIALSFLAIFATQAPLFCGKVQLLNMNGWIETREWVEREHIDAIVDYLEQYLDSLKEDSKEQAILAFVFDECRKNRLPRLLEPTCTAQNIPIEDAINVLICAIARSSTGRYTFSRPYIKHGAYYGGNDRSDNWA